MSNTPEIQARIERLNREHPPKEGMEWRAMAVGEGSNGMVVRFEGLGSYFFLQHADDWALSAQWQGFYFRQVPAEQGRTSDDYCRAAAKRHLREFETSLGLNQVPAGPAGKPDLVSDLCVIADMLEAAGDTYKADAVRVAASVVGETGARSKPAPGPGLDYERHAIPEELYDGHAVFSAMDDKGKKRTGPENVSDVLDAVVRLIKQRIEPKPEPDVEPDESTPWGTPVEYSLSQGVCWHPGLFINKTDNGFRVLPLRDNNTHMVSRCRLRREGK